MDEQLESNKLGDDTHHIFLSERLDEVCHGADHIPYDDHDSQEVDGDWVLEFIAVIYHELAHRDAVPDGGEAAEVEH